jgi:hypothetical protein
MKRFTLPALVALTLGEPGAKWLIVRLTESLAASFAGAALAETGRATNPATAINTAVIPATNLRIFNTIHPHYMGCNWFSYTQSIRVETLEIAMTRMSS